MKKLLFITPELPYPPHSGGKVKSLKLLDALAQRYAVTLVSPLKKHDHRYSPDFEKRSPCARHVHRRIDVPRTPRALLGSYLKGRPLNVHRTYNRELARQVDKLAPGHEMIFVDHYEVASYVPGDYHGIVVYHAHNAYHQLWDRYARLPGNPATRLAAFAEARRVRKAELTIAKRARLVFAAPNDAELLVAGGVPRENIAPTYHLGDDGHLDRPLLDFKHTEKRLMYVGFLGWEANVLGLLWFIDKVWPRLIKEHPDLKFHIIGKDPDARLRRLSAMHPGIELRGFVANLESEYRKARVSVAPLLFGSGMKVKVLDAMARGMPTVTTPVGAEGIEYTDAVHLAVAGSAEAMAEATLALLSDGALWQRLSRQSRALIAERYTWRALFKAMHRALEQLEAPQARAPSPREPQRLNGGR